MRRGQERKESCHVACSPVGQEVVTGNPRQTSKKSRCYGPHGGKLEEKALTEAWRNRVSSEGCLGEWVGFEAL